MEIDLNADVGESFGRWVLGDDDALLDLVTSANVACGFHAGDPATLRRTCVAAARRGVRIGAQVGYRDLAGFGRRFVDVAADDLAADVLYQLGALGAMARAAGRRVRYVKPHGALYAAVTTHPTQAGAVVEAITAFDPDLVVLGAPGSVLLTFAKGVTSGYVPLGGVAINDAIYSTFADRAYRSDGSLVPRTEPGAVLHDPAHIAARAVEMIVDGSVLADDGARVAIRADSLCLHGDTPGAVGIARAVRRALADAGVRIAAFTPE